MTTIRASDVALVRLNVLADYRYLNVVSACLGAFMEQVDAGSERDSATRDTMTYNVQLAVHEACVNIVEHAYNGRMDDARRDRIKVQVSLSGAPRQLVVDLYDNGRPFESSGNAPTPEGDTGEPQVHGYGLFLMRELMDEVQYERLQERNHWRLSKRL